MKNFKIELIGNFPEGDYASLDQKSNFELTIDAKISIKGIPIIQDNGKPEITLFLPADFNWLLDVIEGKEETLCLTDFGSVIYFRKKGDFYSITLSGKSRKGQKPIKDIMVSCEEVEKEVLSIVSKFIDVVREKNPKLLGTLYMKKLVAALDVLAQD